MAKKIIIADTSSLIALSNIGDLELLRKLHEEILITSQIAEEFGLTLPSWIKIEGIKDQKIFKLLKLELDAGESSAIALALENKESLLIIDEKKGREIAKKMDIKITGILGLMLRAKELGLLKKIKPHLDSLDRAGFRMSSQIRVQILRRAGE
ncbi:MAG: DUF3368 domain-containing protein [Schleiferiaceae bacterium]|nr:DUF3368 domain-containing protein [Schleiferiaceae bacterium]MDR9443084.1 DUF3368 domain-containing protein [Schleiferiaceae bacterium]